MGAGRLDQAHFSEFLSFFRGSSLVFSGGTNCREASEKHRLIAIEMLVDAAAGASASKSRTTQEMCYPIAK